MFVVAFFSALAFIATLTVATAKEKGLTKQTPMSAAAQPAERTNVGTLSCSATTTKNVTKPVLRRLFCNFKPVDGDKKVAYEGEIIHRGPNITIRSNEVMIWNVWAKGSAPVSQSLLGKYFGMRDDDPLRPGLGANTLVGGKSRALLLEPVVNPGTRNKDVSVLSVVELELRAARI